jgi:ElaB/YqjD/DUF883 family membrane-anchored ribosome-binding protein
MNKRSEPSSLAEAIEKLEAASHAKVNDFKENLGKEYQELKAALENLKPYLNDLKNNIENGAKETKGKVENQVKDHPWYAIGIIGLLGFIIGWLLGSRKNS